jgi:hypothetical protein
MFTTGSKLFLGATTLSIVATIVYAVTKGGDTGWSATIGLLSLSTALAFLTGVNFYVRDNNVSAAQPDAIANAPAAQDPPTTSMWPAVAALGAALLVIGLVTEPIVFKAGVVVLLAVLVEWMVQGWSERASADPEYNASIRQRMLHPLEFPLLAAAGLGVIIFSFSRIMLFLSKSGGPLAFGIIASLVLFAGFLFASRRNLRRSVALGVCGIAALGLVSTGAAAAIGGERELHEHATVGNTPDVCTSNEETEVDEKGSQSVAAKNGIAAIIRYDGAQLVADVSGTHEPTNTMTVQRSNPTFLIFENHSDEHVRMTAHLGTFERDVNGTMVKESPITCTQLVEPGGKQQLTLTFSKASVATPDDPYRLTVPGFDQAITIVVP